MATTVHSDASPGPKNRQWGIDLSVIIILGAFTAITISWSMAQESKWAMFAVMALTFFSVFLVARQKIKFLLLLYFFTIQLDLDFSPIYVPSAETVILPLYGTAIAIYELPMLALYAAWLVRLVADPREKLRLFPWITVPMLVIFVAALSGIDRSLAPDVVKYTCLWKIFEGWLFVIFIANNLKDVKTIKFCVLVLLSTILFQAAMGAGQLATGGKLGLEILGENVDSFRLDQAGASMVSRVGGTFAAGLLSAYLGLLLPINLALLFAPIDRNLRFRRLLPLFVIGCLLNVMTFSRAGWTGLTIGGSLTLYWCLARVARHRIMSWALLTGYLLMFGISVILLVTPIKKRLFEEDYGAAKSRIPMMQVARNMIADKPFLGIGLANYTSISHLYDNTAEAITYNFPYPVHNEFMLIASELGLPAMCMFILILLVTLIRLYRTARSRDDPLLPFLAMGLFGSIITWTVNSQFNIIYVLTTFRLWTLIGIALAAYIVLKEKRGLDSSASSPS